MKRNDDGTLQLVARLQKQESTKGIHERVCSEALFAFLGGFASSRESSGAQQGPSKRGKPTLLQLSQNEKAVAYLSQRIEKVGKKMYGTPLVFGLGPTGNIDSIERDD